MTILEPPNEEMRPPREHLMDWYKIIRQTPFQWDVLVFILHNRRRCLSEKFEIREPHRKVKLDVNRFYTVV